MKTAQNNDFYIMYFSFIMLYIAKNESLKNTIIYFYFREFPLIHTKRDGEY